MMGGIGGSAGASRCVVTDPARFSRAVLQAVYNDGHIMVRLASMLSKRFHDSNIPAILLTTQQTTLPIPYSLLKAWKIPR